MAKGSSPDQPKDYEMVNQYVDDDFQYTNTDQEEAFDSFTGYSFTDGEDSVNVLIQQNDKSEWFDPELVVSEYSMLPDALKENVDEIVLLRGQKGVLGYSRDTDMEDRRIYVVTDTLANRNNEILGNTIAHETTHNWQYHFDIDKMGGDFNDACKSDAKNPNANPFLNLENDDGEKFAMVTLYAARCHIIQENMSEASALYHDDRDKFIKDFPAIGKFFDQNTFQGRTDLHRDTHQNDPSWSAKIPGTAIKRMENIVFYGMKDIYIISIKESGVLDMRGSGKSKRTKSYKDWQNGKEGRSMKEPEWMNPGMNPSKDKVVLARDVINTSWKKKGKK
jgi:hypothetical protein